MQCWDAAREQFDFAMLMTGFLRPTSCALFTRRIMPTLQMVEEHVMGSGVAQQGELKSSVAVENLGIRVLGDGAGGWVCALPAPLLRPNQRHDPSHPIRRDWQL